MLVSVPKVSIDGESHGDLLLIAIGSGASIAVVILFVLTSLIRHKKQPAKGKKHDASQIKYIGDFTLAPSPSDSGISNASTQKSNLMFKYFGKSLSSFDLERAEEASVDSAGQGKSPGCFVISIDTSDERHVYRQNILTVSELKSLQGVDEKPQTFKYIQTIAC